MSVELFVLEGDNNSPHYEVVALEGDFNPSEELNGELYGELAVDTVVIEKTDLNGNVTEYKIGLNPDHELYGFKMPKVKAPKIKVKAPKMKMRMRVNTKGISKGFKSVGNAVSSAGKAYGKAWEGVGKGAGKLVSSVGQSLGKAGSSLMDMMNQDGGEGEGEEEPEEEQTDETESENSDSDNSDVASEELNGFLSMIGAAAGSIVAPGIGTGIGSSLGSMLEKKKKGKAKPKKQTRKPSRPQESSNNNYSQPQNFNPQSAFSSLQQFVPQGQNMPSFSSFGNTAINKINQYNQQASNQNQAYQQMFEQSFPTMLKQYNDGSLSMSFGSDKNLWELDGEVNEELNGFWNFLGIPDKQEVQNHMIMSAGAGIAVGFLLSAFINKKKKRKK